MVYEIETGDVFRAAYLVSRGGRVRGPGNDRGFFSIGSMADFLSCRSILDSLRIWSIKTSSS